MTAGEKEETPRRAARSESPARRKKRSAEDKSRKAPCLTIIQKRRVKHARCQNTDFQSFILCGPETKVTQETPHLLSRNQVKTSCFILIVYVSHLSH